MKKTLFFISVLLVVFFSDASSKTKPYKYATLNKRIEAIMEQYDAIGVSCAVVRKDKIIYSHSFGRNTDYSHPKSIIPLNNDGLYYWASVSKIFIGTAIMQLVERQKLTLEDDINKYLGFNVRNPNFPDVPITIRMLLCHRGSLKKNAPYKSFDNLNPKHNKSFDELWNKYKPGKKYDYSNLGFVILGAVIENVSGMRLDDYIEKNILSPLGIYGGYDVTRLDSSRFVRTYRYDKKKDKFTKCHDTYERFDDALKQYELGLSTPLLRPAGGMIMSVNDMAKFMMMHMNKGELSHKPRIISDKSEALMQEKQNKTAFGLSMVHLKGYIPEKDMVGMNGKALGIHSVMLFSPKERFGFVIICNGCKSKDSSGTEMNKQIMHELYTTFIKDK